MYFTATITIHHSEGLALSMGGGVFHAGGVVHHGECTFHGGGMSLEGFDFGPHLVDGWQGGGIHVG